MDEIGSLRSPTPVRPAAPKPSSRLLFARRRGCCGIVRTVARPEIAGFPDGDDEGPPRNGATEFFGNRQRRAMLKHIERSGLVSGFRLLRGLVGCVGEA